MSVASIASVEEYVSSHAGSLHSFTQFLTTTKKCHLKALGLNPTSYSGSTFLSLMTLPFTLSGSHCEPFVTDELSDNYKTLLDEFHNLLKPFIECVKQAKCQQSHYIAMGTLRNCRYSCFPTPLQGLKWAIQTVSAIAQGSTPSPDPCATAFCDFALKKYKKSKTSSRNPIAFEEACYFLTCFNDADHGALQVIASFPPLQHFAISEWSVIWVEMEKVIVSLLENNNLINDPLIQDKLTTIKGLSVNWTGSQTSTKTVKVEPLLHLINGSWEIKEKSSAKSPPSSLPSSTPTFDQSSFSNSWIPHEIANMKEQLQNVIFNPVSTIVVETLNSLQEFTSSTGPVVVLASDIDSQSLKEFILSLNVQGHAFLLGPCNDNDFVKIQGWNDGSQPLFNLSYYTMNEISENSGPIALYSQTCVGFFAYLIHRFVHPLSNNTKDWNCSIIGIGNVRNLLIPAGICCGFNKVFTTEPDWPYQETLSDLLLWKLLNSGDRVVLPSVLWSSLKQLTLAVTPVQHYETAAPMDLQISATTAQDLDNVTPSASVTMILNKGTNKRAAKSTNSNEPFMDVMNKAREKSKKRARAQPSQEY